MFSKLSVREARPQNGIMASRGGMLVQLTFPMLKQCSWTIFVHDISLPGPHPCQLNWCPSAYFFNDISLLSPHIRVLSWCSWICCSVTFRCQSHLPVTSTGAPELTCSTIFCSRDHRPWPPLSLLDLLFPWHCALANTSCDIKLCPWIHFSYDMSRSWTHSCALKWCWRLTTLWHFTYLGTTPYLADTLALRGADESFKRSFTELANRRKHQGEYNCSRRSQRADLEANSYCELLNGNNFAIYYFNFDIIMSAKPHVLQHFCAILCDARTSGESRDVNNSTIYYITLILSCGPNHHGLSISASFSAMSGPLVSR